MSTFDELVGEYQTELFGDRLLRRVRLLMRRLLRGRDPKVYARGAHNLEDGLDDAVNDFVLDVLVKQSDPQIVYIMDTATSLEDLDRLILRHARRYLARTRTRTVTDNLIDRSRALLRSHPYQVVSGTGSSEAYGLIGANHPPPDGRREERIRTGASLARAVPKMPSEGSQRAPRVYDASGLAAVLRLLVDTLEQPVRLADLQDFFDELLTAWTPSLLGLRDDSDRDSPSASAEEEAIVRSAAAALVAEMNHEERVIFLFKHAGLPDRLVAERLGLSRQSVDPRKRALFDRLRIELRDFDPSMQAEVVRQVTLDLSALGLEAP